MNQELFLRPRAKFLSLWFVKNIKHKQQTAIMSQIYLSFKANPQEARILMLLLRVYVVLWYV